MGSSLEQLRWKILVNREGDHRIPFIYAVMTTGIYCRPGCSSKLPKRENVRFFDSPEEAELAGFRPCKRCRPDRVSPDRERERRILECCRMMERSERNLTLAELAKAAGLSPHYFHRQFKKLLGLTPKAYMKACRARHFSDRLAEGRSVTEAIYAAGYGSSSRAYEEASRRLGMMPAQFRNGGAGEQICYTLFDTPFGNLLLAATSKGVCCIELGRDEEALLKRLQDRFDRAELIPDDQALADWRVRIENYMASPATGLELPLDVQGTLFQQQVWQALQSVPPGDSLSYSELAGKIGRPGAARAVASACAGNPVALAIPCHRAVRQDGRSTPFRWGRELKQELLRKEAGKE